MRLILLIGFSLSLTSSCFGSVLRCASNDEDPSCLPNMEQKGISNLSWGNQCAPGTYWKTECNTCTCEPGGFATCTKVGCDNERSRVCAPGSQWTNDCNATCWCIDGQPKCNKDCTVSLDTNKRKVLELKEGEECAPGTAWHTECNSCICSPQGLAMCTLNSCLNERKTKCAPNTFWKYQCNSCYCYDGRPLCTLLACESPDGKTNKTTMKQPENKECVPGTSWKTDCNECSCQPDGFRICTNFHCDENDPVLFEESTTKKSPELNSTLVRKVRGLSQGPLKACQPGSEFRMDCNQCLCDDEGQAFSCTRIDCNAQNNNNNGGLRSKRDTTEKIATQCTPGSVFERGCNVCRCTGEGEALCTNNKCGKVYTVEVTSATPAPAVNSNVDSNFRCNPGEQFNFECNDCTCSADGKDVFCTLRLCDQSLYPDI
ncbi:laminin subunit alpha-5-like isoform X4 [Galleria mellonella]|uniref:Laminin subunit alpha-5-like isoform X4 n=1 Tax=Galleria mellonella TaxID=7137 RepID=A0ABM3MY64_GALME|nr:laminin subunit alpha-5-like isoform X4 [Galleria mellonella]